MSQSITKDEDYYLGYSIYLVENTLFKLPTHLLERPSCVFSTVFTLPPPDEGQTDDKPIRLEGIKKDDFRLILKVLYQKKFRDERLSEDEWISILRLSIQWKMDPIRTLAVDELYAPLIKCPNKMITLGRQYGIDEWVFTGLDILVRRTEPLGEEEVIALGVDEVLKLASLRESVGLRRKNPVHSSEKIDIKIGDEFGLSIPDGDFRADL